MNATMGINYEDMEMSYAVDFGRDREPTQNRSRRPAYRRAGSGPARVNGIHHRRNKRWTWGSGRGARMQNVRAFAGCLAVAVAGFASSALGVTIDFTTIGNPGNAGKVVGSGTYGSVASTFSLSRTETTNAQYVEFLNAVGSANTNGVYSASMNSDANGGITQSGTSGSFTYALKTGTNAAGQAFGDVPVNFVSWFSAARFVNWLANGQLSGTAGIASMEVGSYTLNNVTSGSIIPRNSNASIFLPSLNEFYKASFYNGSGYNLWATSSGTSTPSVAATTVQASGTNVATYGNAGAGVSGPLPVTSFTNSLSPYGLYAMTGNIAEYTDTTNGSGSAAAMSGSWGTNAITNFNSNFGTSGNVTYVAGTTSTAQVGFRVAAVPEPGTIALAITGMLGMVGTGWLKRRKRQAMLLAEAETITA